MKSLLSSNPGTDCGARHVERTETERDDARQAPACPGPLASFARFVLLGGGVGIASSAAVALLGGLMPWALANALITVASTILCTELHARFTFGSGRRAGWRQHAQSAGSASAAYAATTAAMLILHMVQPSAGMPTEQAVYLSASALAGTGRFLVLRLYVFAVGRNKATEPTKSPAPLRTTIATGSASIPAPALAGELLLPIATADSAASAFRGSSGCRTVGRRMATGHRQARRSASAGAGNPGAPAEELGRPEACHLPSASERGTGAPRKEPGYAGARTRSRSARRDGMPGPKAGDLVAMANQA